MSINGTQGNAVNSDLGRIPDTEDLNRNGLVDLTNSYFRYAIPLDTNSLTNPYIKGGGGFKDNGDKINWYLYRIPIVDTAKNVGTPSFEDVEYIRLFVQGVTDTVHVSFVEFNLVGSQWQKEIPNDSTLAISVINLEENPEYVSPPGVERERDRSETESIVQKNEQSLNLILRDIERRRIALGY